MKECSKIKRTTLRIKSISENKKTNLSIICGDSQANLSVVTLDNVSFEPDKLMFSQEHYNKQYGKQSLQIIAPEKLINIHGHDLHVQSDNEDIVILEGSYKKLNFIEDLGYFEANINLDLRKIGAKGKLRATLGSQNKEFATATITVKANTSRSIECKFDYTPLTKDISYLRSVYNEDNSTLTIYAQHHALKNYIPVLEVEKDKYEEYELIQIKESSMIISEAMAEGLANFKINKLLLTETDESLDLSIMINKITKERDKFLRMARRSFNI